MRSLKSDLNHTKIIMRDIIFSWEMECAKRKLAQLFGDEYTITVEINKNKGCRCEIIFPGV